MRSKHSHPLSTRRDHELALKYASPRTGRFTGVSAYQEHQADGGPPRPQRHVNASAATAGWVRARIDCTAGRITRRRVVEMARTVIVIRRLTDRARAHARVASEACTRSPRRTRVQSPQMRGGADPERDRERERGGADPECNREPEPEPERARPRRSATCDGSPTRHGDARCARMCANRYRLPTPDNTFSLRCDQIAADG
jgi:hypothetical protein